MLPTLGYEYTERVVTDSFAGLNRQLRIAEGEFYDMKNLTSACYPLLANRKKRGRVRALEDSLTDTGYDCSSVLGCQVWGDRPSHLLSDRLDVGIALYHAGVAPKILMSGDHGQTDYDEVNAMREYALAHGVPSEDIFMDHAGFSLAGGRCFRDR